MPQRRQQGSMSPSAAFTFGPFSSAASILGVQLWDAQVAGNMLLIGTLMTARTLGASDNLGILPTQLLITLA
jgi:hypothetical protein